MDEQVKHVSFVNIKEKILNITDFIMPVKNSQYYLTRREKNY